MPRGPALRITVCRGCCCGNRLKHPAIDHAAQVRSLRTAVAAHGNAQLRVVACLSHCESSNVVVVSGVTGIRGPVWLRGMLVPALVEDLCEWVSAGAVTPLPETLLMQVLDPRAPIPAVAGGPFCSPDA